MPTLADGPDRLPPISLSEEEKEYTPQGAKIVIPDSLLAPNTLSFAGQTLDLDPLHRQRKLRRELVALRHVAGGMMDRASRYFSVIEPILARYKIPNDFKYLMVIESGGNPDAQSPAGAVGLWQFMPATARQYGLRVEGRHDERRHVIRSTEAACRYLQDAHRRFGDWVAAAQSYNIGQGRIDKELKRQAGKESIDLSLVEETNRYVYRILAIKILFTHPTNFGLNASPHVYKKKRI